jgi:hypothetical protein
MKKLKYLVVIVVFLFSFHVVQAFPGDSENHGQGYDQGNAPDDPGGGGPVGPIDGGLGLLLAGSLCYWFFKNKRKAK